MKRFFGLMLVAVLLVSAMSMQAFAFGGFPGGGSTFPGGGDTFPGGGNTFPGGGNTFPGGYTCNHDSKTLVSNTATCEADGIATYSCNNPFCTEKEIEVPATKLGHAYGEYEVTKEATCEAAGEKVATCANDASHKDIQPIAKLGHAYGEYEVTKEATCKEAGEKTATCANDASHKDIQPIAKLTAPEDHEYEDGVCTVCGDKKGYALTFWYKDAEGNKTSSMATIKNNEYIRFPEVPEVSGLKHTGWKAIDGKNYDAVWNVGEATTFEATYVESTDDGLVDLTVYAYYYVDGEYHHKAKLFVEEFKESKHNNMVPWIYSEGISEVKTALAAEHGADGYQWNPTVFYNCYGDGEISAWGDLKADGNKSIYVKVNSKKAIEATVLLHIHTKQEYAIARTVKMSGYTAGDFVSYNDALAKVKNYYTGSKMTMSDLYSDSDWEDLMDGLKSSGSKTIKVEDNGTTEIHVIVKNATSKTSSNADTTNPKTGDSIMIAVGTMAMAAAALVTLAELKKRKMI